MSASWWWPRSGAGAASRPVEPGIPLFDAPELTSPLAFPPGRPPPWGSTLLVAGLVAIGAAALSRPWIGLVAGAATLLTSRVPRARALPALAIPLSLALARQGPTPDLGWLAVALLASDLASGWLRRQNAPPRSTATHAPLRPGSPPAG